MIKLKRIFSVILCVMIMILSCVFAAYAKIDLSGDAPAETEQKEEIPRIIICANRGNWKEYPENSLEAVENCAADYISIDIKVTADKIPVLMADETVERTCVDKDGKSAKGTVSSMKLEDINKLFLREGNGGPHNKKTDSTVPTLQNILEKQPAKYFVLDFNIKDLDAVYDTVAAAGSQQRVIFRIDGKRDDIISVLSEKDKVPETIIKYDGNIIFSVNSTIKEAKKSGLNFVQLGTKNQSGVIFYNGVEQKIRANKLTAAFSMTDGYNGKRGDNLSGWDDVISHGYSFIETDYPELLSQYVAQTDYIRSRLFELIDKKDEYKSGAYPKNLIEEYNNAVKSAEELIKNTASQSQLSTAYTRLDNARNALNLAQGTSTSQSVLNFSAGRIIAAVLCLGVVVWAQIFFVKRRKK